MEGGRKRGPMRCQYALENFLGRPSAPGILLSGSDVSADSKSFMVMGEDRSVLTSGGGNDRWVFHIGWSGLPSEVCLYKFLKNLEAWLWISSGV